ncbi:MAG: flagellar hook-basal body complex protein [Lachnospiraceae bacterium]
MMRSLFSGVSGLKTHQTKMDVIGNNIANVNTVGFKSSSVTFSELMYQTTQSASGANAATGRGGVNAKQIGLGVTSGAINTNITTSGASQTTGNPFDLQITGDSFFIVSDGSQNYFTRAGAFYVDGAGNLAMTSNGFTVMGWAEDETTPGTIKKDIVQPLKVMTAENMTSEPEATTEAYIAGILDKNSTQLSSTSGQIVTISFFDNTGESYVAKYAVYNHDKAGTALEDGVYRMELTDVLDSTGTSITKTGATTTDLKNFVTINGAKTNDYCNTIYLKYSTSSGKYLGYWSGDVSAAPTYAATTGFNANTDTDDKKFSMTFDTATYDKFPAAIKVSMKTSTRYDNSGTSTIAGKTGDYDGNYTGRKYGTMSAISIDTSGKIYASYDNGTSKLLGQIAVASFANPSGLEKIGENLYQTTQNSGAFNGVGEDVTSDGVSKMSTGVLEMSNVDLSSEFTEMITTQRGFQANSRIITVSDTLLEELTNLKR